MGRRKEGLYLKGRSMNKCKGKEEQGLGKSKKGKCKVDEGGGGKGRIRRHP